MACAHRHELVGFRRGRVGADKERGVGERRGGAGGEHHRSDAEIGLQVGKPKHRLHQAAVACRTEGSCVPSAAL